MGTALFVLDRDGTKERLSTPFAGVLCYVVELGF